MLLASFSDVDVLASDLRQLGHAYLTTLRRVARNDMALAVKLFGVRRPESLHRICRMSSSQIDTLLEFGGLPFSVGDQAAVSADLRDLANARPAILLDPALDAECAALQMALLERLRQVARESPTAAAQMFRLKDVTTTIKEIVELDLSQLLQLSRLQHFLALNVTVGYQLLVAMVCADMGADRLVIAGMAAAVPYRHLADHSLDRAEEVRL
ncbi:MAG: hypothetical protein ACYC9L_03070 [Sulfuricaulis sp.]